MGHKGPFGAVLGHFETITETSVKNGVWGPVEWVEDQLTGWGGTTVNLNSKRNTILIRATVTKIFVENRFYIAKPMGFKKASFQL